MNRISETRGDLRSNIHIIGFLGEKKDEAEKLFKEIMAENVPNLAKDINQQTQEAERIPKKFTPRHVMIKSLKTKAKEKILKADLS